MIANECLHRIIQHERIQGMRCRRQHYGICHRPEVVQVSQSVTEDFRSTDRRSIELLYSVVVPQLVEEFVRALTGIGQLYAIYELRQRQVLNLEPESFAIARDDHQTGLIIFLAKSYNHARLTMDFTLAIGVDRAI